MTCGDPIPNDSELALNETIINMKERILDYACCAPLNGGNGLIMIGDMCEAFQN